MSTRYIIGLYIGSVCGAISASVVDMWLAMNILDGFIYFDYNNYICLYIISATSLWPGLAGLTEGVTRCCHNDKVHCCRVTTLLKEISHYVIIQHSSLHLETCLSYNKLIRRKPCRLPPLDQNFLPFHSTPLFFALLSTGNGSSYHAAHTKPSQAEQAREANRQQSGMFLSFSAKNLSTGRLHTFVAALLVFRSPTEILHWRRRRRRQRRRETKRPHATTWQRP
jgi:hypothetical protein